MPILSDEEVERIARELINRYRRYIDMMGVIIKDGKIEELDDDFFKGCEKLFGELFQMWEQRDQMPPADRQYLEYLFNAFIFRELIDLHKTIPLKMHEKAKAEKDLKRELNIRKSLLKQLERLKELEELIASKIKLTIASEMPDGLGNVIREVRKMIARIEGRDDKERDERSGFARIYFRVAELSK